MSVIVLTALIQAVDSDAGDPMIANMFVNIEQDLPKVGEGTDAEGFQASVGTTVQLSVEILLKDGSRKTVTKDPNTKYFSLDGQVVIVSEGGQVDFVSTKGEPAAVAGIMVTYAKIVRAIMFEVVP